MKDLQITKKERKFDETKLVVITRGDIPNGYVCVQSCHSIADFAADFPQYFSKWKKQSNSIICLSVKNEEELLRLYEKFKDKIPIVKFFEPDIDEHTSICLYGEKPIRKKLSHLPLVLKKKKGGNNG